MNLLRVLQHPFLRKPLLFLVVGECLLVVAAGTVAWHVWQAHQNAAAPVVRMPVTRSPGEGRGQARLPPPSVRPTPPSPAPAAPSGLGLRFDADFLNRQLGDINHDQAALENVEWRLVRAAMQGMKLYLERIVLPLVDRAEGHPR